MTRPSSARWVELSSTRGTYEQTKLKVMEIRKQHEYNRQPGIGSLTEFSSLNRVLDKQRRVEDRASKRALGLYSPKKRVVKQLDAEEKAR